MQERKKNSEGTEQARAFPRIWRVGGTVQVLPKGRRHVGYAGKSYYWDNFPVDYVLNYPINQFKICVNESNYSMSNLPPLNITTNIKAKWDLKEPYFQSLVGAWIATYTSFMRFHVYFTTRRIMKEFETLQDNEIQDILNKFKAGFIKDHTPKLDLARSFGYKNEHLGQGVIDTSKFKRLYGPGVGLIRDLQNDYKKFVPKVSDGLTIQGTELLNHSIESYIYSVLGAQARTKQSIYGPGASALETQNVFRQIVEDSVINYDTSTWINNMNQAITSTNVVLNIAISPTLSLIPSSLIMLEKPIVGYNNKLKASDETMKFGLNKNVNYYGTTSNQSKKIHQDSVISPHLDTLDDKPIDTQIIPAAAHREIISKATTSKAVTHSSEQGVLQVVLVASVIGGILISKYLL